ncbi:MAG: thiamine pyrophosphate-dependent dehydrogenase E1 component subunit alpha [Candidatus Eremiobacteraeota bacterium]|nr:thiamine pyrophosphate-dependent dehydrogenase E1 component subunit alpha [Candidatus Eremiobacteraeota bacterium]
MAESRVELGLSFLRTMVRIREFEQHARIGYDRGEIPGVVHLSIGQEAVAAGVCANLGRNDYVASTHRGHGHCVAKGANTAAMMSELFGKSTGTNKGKGGSMHIADFSVGMLGANGVVGGGIGIAVGAAQASRLLRKSNVSVCFFGDGAVNRGPFLEGLNWAVVFRLPVLFVCEDNAFSAFTRSSSTTAGKGATARAEAIGLRTAAVDGNSVFAVYDAAAELLKHVRAGEGPAFLYAPTYRLDGHTVFDTAPYRSNEEVERHREDDPVAYLESRLHQWGVDGTQLDKIHVDAREEMLRAMEAARSAPLPAEADALLDVQLIGAPS